MKKLLIGILVIIPLLVVTAVMATVRFIETEVALPVDKITVLFNGEATSFQTVAVSESGTLSVSVTPSGARNKKSSYAFELGERYADYSDADRPRVEFMYEFDQATGRITFKQVGELKVTAVADDGGHKSIIIFNIVQENIAAVEVGDIAAENLVFGKAFRLPTTITPIDAKDGRLGFSSNNESVATVDKNGIVNCVGTGEVTFTAYSLADDSVVGSKTVTIASLPSAQIFLTGEVLTKSATVDCAKFINSAATLDFTASGAALNGTVLTFTEGVAATASLSQGAQTLTVVYNPEAKGIAFKNAALLPENLFNDKTQAFLTVESTVEGFTFGEVVWRSSDDTVATVVNGVVTPKKSGYVTITAETQGTTATADFYCTQGILGAWLNYNKNFEEEHFGLKGEVVFGSTKLEDTVEVTNTLQLMVDNTYPEQEVEGIEVNKLFNWSSSDESIATVDANGLVTVVPQTAKGTVIAVISATPKIKMYESHSIVVKYSLKVNEGVDVDTYDEFKRIINEGQNNYVANAELTKAYEEAEEGAEAPELAVLRTANLHGDIMLWRPETDWLGSSCIDFYSDIIGNGYMINANEVVPDEMTGWPYPVTRTRGNNVTLDNIHWKGCDFTGEDVGDLREVARCGELIGADINYGKTLDNIVIKNCIVENAYNGIVIHQANALLAGNVVRNMYALGVNVRAFTSFSEHSYNDEYTNEQMQALSAEDKDAIMKELGSITVTIKNMVMYDCLHACIYIHNQTGGKRECYNNVLKFEGFLRSYNWRREDQISIEGVFGESVKESFPIIKQILPLIKIGDILSSKGNFAKTDADGMKYYNIAVMEFSVESMMNETWDLSYAEDFPWKPVGIRLIKIAGVDVLAHPGDSDFIELGDAFSPEDRAAMRED